MIDFFGLVFVGGFHVAELHLAVILHEESRAFVVIYGLQAYVSQQDVLSMTDGQSPCWLDAMSRWFRIPTSLMSTDDGRAVVAEEEWVAVALLLHIVYCQSTEKLDVDVA